MISRNKNITNLNFSPSNALCGMLRITELIVIILFTIFFHRPTLAADPLPVFVSINPQKYFVQQIGKDLVNVQVMVPPGADPHTYEPKPGQMADLSKTQVYFAIGVPFEHIWLKKLGAANPEMKIVHTDGGIAKIPMATHHHDEEESHHEANQHMHRGLDPHIWLSPPLVKIQAGTILKTLQEMDPSHQAVYQENYQQFCDQIDRLDNELKAIFADKQGLPFMVFHPSWGYFARAYGLRQMAVEIEGKDPKPAQLKALIEHAKKEGIKVIFVQPQFSTKSAQLVAREIGGQVVVADPLAGDWLANLRDVSQKFKAALK
jgi:zinc transport system substrate-binding protein